MVKSDSPQLAAVAAMLPTAGEGGAEPDGAEARNKLVNGNEVQLIVPPHPPYAHAHLSIADSLQSPYSRRLPATSLQLLHPCSSPVLWHHRAWNRMPCQYQHTNIYRGCTDLYQSCTAVLCELACSSLDTWTCCSLIPCCLVNMCDTMSTKVHALVREWLTWCRQRCQAPGGGLAQPPNQICADLRVASNIMVCHLLKLASHANAGAAVDTLQSWVLLMFVPTLRDSSRKGTGLPTQKAPALVLGLVLVLVLAQL